MRPSIRYAVWMLVPLKLLLPPTLALPYLETATTKANQWASGDLVHKGHLVLGRIAVREGRLDDAERHLRASANTKGSPVMKSFGPNMSLAKDLWEAGRSAAVLEYFEACGQFWTRVSVAWAAGRPPFVPGRFPISERIWFIEKPRLRG